MISWVISDKAMIWILINGIFLFTFLQTKEKGKKAIETAWQKTYDGVDKVEKALTETLTKKSKAE